MVNNFTAIKFWKKEVSIFTSLNLNVSFHKAIKKTSPNAVLVKQEQMTKQSRIDYLKLLAKDDPIDFLEFGVFEGNSIFGVAKHNTNPQSRFFGFDAFDDGYPEVFDNHSKGDYATSTPQSID